jgi:hypothetical protein
MVDWVGRVGINFVVMLCVGFLMRCNGRGFVPDNAARVCCSKKYVEDGLVCVRSGYVKWSCICRENPWLLSLSVGDFWYRVGESKFWLGAKCITCKSRYLMKMMCV